MTEEHGKPAMTKSKTHRVFENGIPETYSDLIAVLAPRTIHDRVDHENVLEIIHALAGLDLNEDQEDYFETLATLVNDYEAKHLPSLPAAKPIDALRYLVEQNNISSRELGRILGKDESLGAKILSEDRKITVDHAKRLAERFGVSASVFLDI